MVIAFTRLTRIKTNATNPRALSAALTSHSNALALGLESGAADLLARVKTASSDCAASASSYRF